MDLPPQPPGSKGGGATSSDAGATSSQQNRETRSKYQLANPTSKDTVNNAMEGRQHLNKISMTPVGAEISAKSLVTTLLFIAEAKGVTGPTRSAVQSVAFILEELVKEAAHAVDI
jgi:hypothetical protein